MNEDPNNIPKKSRPNVPWLRAWLILLAAIFFILVAFIGFTHDWPRNASDWLPSFFVIFAISGFAAGVFLCLWFFVRWFFCPRNIKRSLFMLACIATLIALFYAEEDWRGWHAWNSFKHEWEAKGEHFDMAGVAPAPVPDDQNFALTPLVASCYEMYFDKSGHELRPRNTNVVDRMQFSIWANDKLAPWPTNEGNWQKATTNDLVEWQAYYRTLATKTNLFPVPPAPQSPAADVLLALSIFDPVIEELRADSHLPCSRFPLTYTAESPGSILLPHLAAMKRTSQLLRLRTLAELQAGQPEEALDDLKLSLRLVAAIGTEPFLISHLVRIAMLQIMLQPIWEGLVQHRWSDAQLVALDAELAKLNFLQAYKLSMDGELGCQSGEMDDLRRHPEQLEQLGDFGDGEGNSSHLNLPGNPIARLIPTGWFYQNEFRCARVMVNYFIPVADLSQGIFVPSLARQGDAALKADTQSATPFNVLERLFMPAEGNAARKFAFAQASVNLARTAIALERYRLAHGEYPETLDALAPQFIAQVPHDVIGGQPLKYRREADGLFVLYSVGWNETDDGGVVVMRPKSQSPDISQGDWVWRYPAK